MKEIHLTSKSLMLLILTLWLAVLLSFSSAVALDMPSERYEERREARSEARKNTRAVTEAVKKLVDEQGATNQLLRGLLKEMREERTLMKRQLQALQKCGANTWDVK